MNNESAKSEGHIWIKGNLHLFVPAEQDKIMVSHYIQNPNNPDKTDIMGLCMTIEEANNLFRLLHEALATYMDETKKALEGWAAKTEVNE